MWRTTWMSEELPKIKQKNFGKSVEFFFEKLPQNLQHKGLYLCKFVTFSAQYFFGWCMKLSRGYSLMGARNWPNTLPAKTADTCFAHSWLTKYKNSETRDRLSLVRWRHLTGWKGKFDLTHFQWNNCIVAPTLTLKTPSRLSSKN